MPLNTSRAAADDHDIIYYLLASFIIILCYALATCFKPIIAQIINIYLYIILILFLFYSMKEESVIQRSLKYNGAYETGSEKPFVGSAGIGFVCLRCAR